MIISFPPSSKTPFFLKHLLFSGLFVALFGILSYFFIDLPLSEYFHFKAPAILLTSAQYITDLLHPTIEAFFWPLLYFFFRFVWHRKKRANICLLVWISVALSDGAIEILKRILGRARPELWWSHHLFGFFPLEWQNAFLSFPSGHSGTAGALVGVFSALYPRYRHLCLCLGILFAFTRVILDVHYLSDVLVGVWIGLLIGQKMHQVMKNDL